MELTETLRKFIEEGGDWERKQTTVAGVSIIRLPAMKNRPASLAIDINPVGENGLPMKKKGIMVMNATELQHSGRSSIMTRWTVSSWRSKRFFLNAKPRQNPKKRMSCSYNIIRRAVEMTGIIRSDEH